MLFPVSDGENSLLTFLCQSEGVRYADFSVNRATSSLLTGRALMARLFPCYWEVGGRFFNICLQESKNVNKITVDGFDFWS